MSIRVLAGLTVFLLTLAASAAQADVLKFGVDITPGGVTQVAGGFTGDNTGFTLSNQCLTGGLLGGILCSQKSYAFDIATKGVASSSSIKQAGLWFDTDGLNDASLLGLPGLSGLPELFKVSAYDSALKTYMPIDMLGPGTLLLNLTLFSDEIANGLLKVRIDTLTTFAESVRLDGANLSVTTNVATPEPATLALMGVGLLVATGTRRMRAARRQRIA